ncbi:dTMP kinase [Spectribacter hydrogenoxidans]|uniref:Thymidylate kinase n=1 Tax=Spectribacter hydrogenoxidans TaxID=3075608 RepID=A0ABU3C342_9GAMM|nr:dTMP kinase [Salinisphaera sp. W335]MDT0635978.1 dTMP kinase [Salinisphaera sp. W335]
MSGCFITLEGTEGAGKSSAVPIIRNLLEQAGQRVVVTREPGGTPLAEAIRGVLLADHGEPMPAMSELLLMFAARASHLRDCIEPALAAGAWVICDRFTDASYAYQGAARGLGSDAVATLEQLVQGERRPDRVLWFDLPVEVGIERVNGRGASNRFDRELQAFHEQVRQAYAARAEADPDRYRRVDAAAPSEAVADQIRRLIGALL